MESVTHWIEKYELSKFIHGTVAQVGTECVTKDGIGNLSLAN